MQIKNLVVSGNSFTQDGIGGVPPTSESPGGCSFVDSGETPPSDPQSWASLLAQKLKVQSFINLAACSHGNVMIANSIRSLISKFCYTPDDTLVIFHFSFASRLDVPCEFSHPDSSKFIPWDEQLIEHTYLDRSSKTFHSIAKNIGLDIVESLGYAQMDFLCNWLERKQFNYLMLLTEANDLHNHQFKLLLKDRESKLIKLDPGPGLLEYASLSGNNTENNYHLDAKGRSYVANFLYDYIDNS